MKQVRTARAQRSFALDRDADALTDFEYLVALNRANHGEGRIQWLALEMSIAEGRFALPKLKWRARRDLDGAFACVRLAMQVGPDGFALAEGILDQVDPRDPDAALLRGKLLLARGRTQAAIEWAERFRYVALGVEGEEGATRAKEFAKLAWSSLIKAAGSEKRQAAFLDSLPDSWRRSWPK
ncbi:MAG: hypothetical protein V3W41_07270 [Planctomycetota bacterium]